MTCNRNASDAFNMILNNFLEDANLMKNISENLCLFKSFKKQHAKTFTIKIKSAMARYKSKFETILHVLYDMKFKSVFC